MFKNIAIVLGLLLSTSLYMGLAVAQDTTEKSFIKKRYNIEGTATVEILDGETYLVFSDDFKTKNGPDLRVYLSKIDLSDLSASEVDNSALRLSVLKSHKGAQRYAIPANIDLSDYESVLIQCAAYTVLWGGFDL